MLGRIYSYAQKGLVDGMAFLLMGQEGSGYAAIFAEINEEIRLRRHKESPSLKWILITFTDGIISLSLSLQSRSFASRLSFQSKIKSWP